MKTKSLLEGVIPEVISNFNMYDSNAGRVFGLSDEIELPEWTSITSEISGAGILGTYSADIVGHYEDVDMEIPFKTLCGDMIKFVPGRFHMITFRANMQSTMQKTHEKANLGIKVVVGGTVKGFKTGKLKIGDKMDSSLKINVTYFKYEQNGFVFFELDKINPKLIVNNEDILAPILANC